MRKKEEKTKFQCWGKDSRPKLTANAYKCKLTGKRWLLMRKSLNLTHVELIYNNIRIKRKQMIGTGNQQNQKNNPELSPISDENNEVSSHHGEDKKFSPELEKNFSESLYQIAYLETKEQESTEFDARFGMTVMCGKFSISITNMDLSGSSSPRNSMKSKNFHNQETPTQLRIVSTRL